MRIQTTVIALVCIVGICSCRNALRENILGQWSPVTNFMDETEIVEFESSGKVTQAFECIVTRGLPPNVRSGAVLLRRYYTFSGVYKVLRDHVVISIERGDGITNICTAKLNQGMLEISDAHGRFVYRRVKAHKEIGTGAADKTAIQ